MGHIAGPVIDGKILPPEGIKAWHVHEKLQDKLTVVVVDWGIAAMVLLVAGLMVLEFPRFSVRLYASLPQYAVVRKRRPVHAKSTSEGWNEFDRELPPTPALPSAGGDLFRGWLLRRGTAAPPHGARAIATTEPYPDARPPARVRPRFHALGFYAPLASLLPAPFQSRVGLGQLALMAAFGAISIVVCVYRSDLSLPTAAKDWTGWDLNRTGLVCTAFIPVAVALGVRGNLVGLVIGKGYERIKVMHKWVGRVTVLIASVHSLLFVHKWIMDGTFIKNSSSHSGITGYVAWVAMLLMFFTSLPWFRKRWHGLFKFFHVVGILSLAMVGLHVAGAMPWVASAIALYALSIGASLAKTRYTKAYLVALKDCQMTLVSMPHLTTGWRAGQHVRVRVPALGLRNFLHSHPFTIASAPDTAGLVLLCAAAGDWTKELRALAQTGDSEDKSDVGTYKHDVGVLIEGPYGGPGNTLPASFTSIVLFAGGSGLSYAMGMAHDLVERSRTGAIAARTIDLVWSVRAEGTARPLIPTLAALVDDAQAWEDKIQREAARGGQTMRAPALRIHVYVTRPEGELTLVPSRFAASQSQSPLISPLPSPMFPRGTASVSSSMSDLTLINHASIKNLTPKPHAPTASSYFSTASLGAVRASVADVEELAEGGFASSLKASRGRPNVAGIVAEVTDEALARQGRELSASTGVFVAACGPAALVDDAREACRSLPAWKRHAVGGVDYEAEFFGF
ncbi:hypothetical protein Q8F55_001534 [Vanrija albida]|uniref:ferric-chelate reductase (NADPH) n=1 Tax=Vanrija albida TaxID=181172 RepID=A0ABR3QGY7_9TREE